MADERLAEKALTILHKKAKEALRYYASTWNDTTRPGVLALAHEAVGGKLRHGALYPLLNAMEQKGLLKSKKQQQGGRTRKVYAMIEKGRKYIETYDSVLKEQIQNKT